MRDKVISILKELFPQQDVEHSDNFVDDKIIDSLSIVSLVSELSLQFDVKIGLSDLNPQNFKSVDAIVKTLERLKA